MEKVNICKCPLLVDPWLEKKHAAAAADLDAK